MVIYTLEDLYRCDSEFCPEESLYPKGYMVHEFFGPTLDIVDAICRTTDYDITIVKACIPIPRNKPNNFTPTVHQLRCAVDLQVGDVHQVYSVAKVAKRLGILLEIPVRVGWRRFQDEHIPIVHIDTAPMLADEAWKAGIIRLALRDKWVTNLEW